MMDEYEDFEHPVDEITSEFVDMSKELEVHPERVIELISSLEAPFINDDLLSERQRELLTEQASQSDDKAQPRETMLKN